MYIGERIRRREDPRLITGEGRYTADIGAAGLCHLSFYRSPFPHARIGRIDKQAALAMPGVRGVWTADDLPASARFMADRLPPVLTERPRPVLAAAEACHTGVAIAAVVADEPGQSADAVEALDVELEPLPGVGTVDEAVAEGAPPVHASEASNVAGRLTLGYGDIDEAFGSASITVAETLWMARVCAAAIEPRAVTASFRADELTLWASTSFVHGVRLAVAGAAEMDPAQVRVLAEDVGGGFGAKGAIYPEYVVAALLARSLERPVRWVATRSEDGASTIQTHGLRFELELAAGSDGMLLGVRGKLAFNLGAYTSSAVNQPDNIVSHMISMYRLPALHVQADLIHTNSVPTGFIRGGGRPVGNFAIERMIDRLAQRLGADPAEIRRRNLIRAEEMPYTTGYSSRSGDVVFDGGDYPRLLDLAMAGIGYDEVRRQQAGGRAVGLGLACCTESTGSGMPEPARVRIGPDGTALVSIGSTPQGQSHLTMAAQVVAERLDWPLDRIEVRAGDSSLVPFSSVTAGSRTAVEVGNATALAATAMRKALLNKAAEVLEAAAEDIAVGPEGAQVAGAPTRRVDLTELVPPDGLEVMETFDPGGSKAWASGCHAALVEIDVETGAVEVLRYAIAHDSGREINPIVVEGQIHGGYAHGLGYALLEEAIYEPGGDFRSASFLDYSIASGPEMSVEPEVEHIETASSHNAEGFRGAGESATIPAPAAIANAVEDAIRRLGRDVAVTAIPITSQRVFDLLHGSR
jgi:carbon-monoxide dehydrogenase large subunit